LNHSTPLGKPTTASAIALRPEHALSTHVSAAQSAELDDSLHLRDLLRIIRKRKWWILSIALLALLLAAFHTLMQVPIYRASTVLQIERNAARVVDYKDGNNADQYSYDEREFLATQYELLRSKALAERVMETLRLDLDSRSATKPKIADSEVPKTGARFLDQIMATFRKRSEPSIKDMQVLDREALIGSLRSSVVIEPIRNARLVRIHVENASPSLASKIANAWADTFISSNLERRFEGTAYARTFLEQQLAKTKEKLEESERQFNTYTRQKQIVNVDDKTNLVAQNLTEFTVALARAEQDRIKAESNYEEVKRNLSSSKDVLENKTIALFKENKAKLEAEYQDQLKIYKPGFPKMQQLQGQIEEIDRKIQTETKTVAASVEGSARAAFLAAKSQETQLRARADAAKRSVLELQDQGIRYNILKRDVDTNREIYNGLLQRYKEVGIAGGVGTNNVSVVDKADVPLFPFKPDLQRNALIGLLLGLMAGLAFAFLLEYLDDSIKFPDEVERFTGLALLGVIPKVNTRGPSAANLATTDLRSPIAEAYRSVRTALQFSTGKGAPRTLVVTSCTKNEGKSTTAMAIAVALAQMGKRTLLVDADMRNPSLHRMLDTKHTFGLSNLLAGAADPIALTQTTSFQNLYFMSSGPIPPNPVELLSGPNLPKLLGEGETQFDHIVVDAPPVLGIADSIVLASRVDACIFVVQSMGTRKSSIRSALRRLHQANVRPLGAILTKLGKNESLYGYDADYYYYGAEDAKTKLKIAS
jgi:polysaccharide biosynthesis transport protein